MIWIWFYKKQCVNFSTNNLNINRRGFVEFRVYTNLSCIVLSLKIPSRTILMQGENELYAVDPQSLIISFLIRWFKNFWELFLFFYFWFSVKWLSVQTSQRPIVIHRRGKFVYHYWRCKLNYLSLSSLFRFLLILLYTYNFVRDLKG